MHRLMCEKKIIAQTFNKVLSDIKNLIRQNNEQTKWCAMAEISG